VGLKSDEIRQLLVSADDVDLLGETIDTIKKNKEFLINTSKK
jgi:hypothetical protein